MSSLGNRSVSEISRQGQDRGGRSSPYSRSGPSSRAPTEDRWKHDMFEGHSNGGRYVKSNTPTQKLLIEGLHYEVSEDELRSLFSQIGPVQRSFIKYDRSGRSTGVAIVIYETVDDARAARDEFDGANAKGQPITISFEHMRQPGRNGRSDAAGNGSGDLRSRMDLMSRLSEGGAGGERVRKQAPANAPRGPSAAPSSSRSQPRGGRGGGGGGGRGGGRDSTSNARNAKRAPKTASDLDAELEAFMKAPPSTSAMAESVHAPQPGQDGDVEMQ